MIFSISDYTFDITFIDMTVTGTCVECQMFVCENITQCYKIQVKILIKLTNMMKVMKNIFIYIPTMKYIKKKWPKDNLNGQGFAEGHRSLRFHGVRGHLGRHLGYRKMPTIEQNLLSRSCLSFSLPLQVKPGCFHPLILPFDILWRF